MARLNDSITRQLQDSTSPHDPVYQLTEACSLFREFRSVFFVLLARERSLLGMHSWYKASRLIGDSTWPML